MFWKVAGFSQSSSIEQLLDKNEFTLDELLDDQDIIEECKSLNGRLVAFLRERTTVEQLLRYIVEPPSDATDPKRTYKYPFTACEVLCCEIEAVFSTLVEDTELRRLLFSPLDAEPPLNSKRAGYFSRVLGQLWARKTPEVIAHLQAEPALVERLARHMATSSIADVLKRVIGVEEQSPVVLDQSFLQWLVDKTPVLSIFYVNLASSDPDQREANAEMLTAVAHCQPSPLATEMMRQKYIKLLFPTDNFDYIPAIDVCIALIEPRRLCGEPTATTSALLSGIPGQASPSRVDGAAAAAANASPALDSNGEPLPTRAGAVWAMLSQMKGLIKFLREILEPGPHGGGSGDEHQTMLVLPTTYGVLRPPLGRIRLKIVELLMVLLRCGDAAAEQTLIESGGVKVCLEVCAHYPFHNLLHNHVTAMLLAVLTRSGLALVEHVFKADGGVGLLDWLTTLPVEVRPEPRPGHEAAAQSKPALRAGYLGHVTQIGTLLDAMSQQASTSPAATPAWPAAGAPAAAAPAAAAPASAPWSLSALLEGVAALPPDRLAAVAGHLASHEGWQAWRVTELRSRQEVENTQRWACGRPAVTDLAGLDSDGDEFQNDMDLEAISSLQPQLYHRYHTTDDVVDDDDDDEDAEGGPPVGGPDGLPRSAARSIGGVGGLGTPQQVAAALAGMGLNDPSGSGSHEDDDDDEAEGGLGKAEVDFERRMQENFERLREAEAQTLAAGPSGSGGEGSSRRVRMEDDDVLLATSDDDDGVLADEPPGLRQGTP